MKNILISDLHEKDVEHFTTDTGLFLRRTSDKPFKKMCNLFTNAHIILENGGENLSDEEYFNQLTEEYIPLENYGIQKGKNNIIVERYPKLDKDTPYIFVCNHTCPEDIETVLNILDRNAYLVLGSIESLQYNPEMYLLWLNGMIPFDIMDQQQRKLVFEKMLRVIKTNSILIFPEGSHNYHPNKLVNNLFDGPVNLALQTKRKIVIVTLMRDNENDVSYIDVGNPIDVCDIDVDMNHIFTSEEEIEKYYVKSLSSSLRDYMATAVYHLMVRHFKPLIRADYQDIEKILRQEKIENAFSKLHWEHDVFEAEYLTKKTAAEKEYEEVVRTISALTINPNALKGFSNRNWVLQAIDIEAKDVPQCMRNYWLSMESKTKKVKMLKKEK